MIRLTNISYTYPHADAPALRGISCEVKPGRALVCTGRSGCGKSTLLRVMNGLAPHYLKGRLSGGVHIDGVCASSLTPPVIAESVGTLFQDPERQFFALTVADEIALALQWRGWSRERTEQSVRESAELFGLESMLGQSIFGLSEGQKQKVALAGLLAGKPRALILDEPSANLDPEATRDLAGILQGLKQSGMALVIVDHRLHWLSGLADEVMVLQDGSCAARGDFALLEDQQIRERYGLRDVDCADPRAALPAPDTAGRDVAMACRELDFAYDRGMPVFEKADYSFPRGEIIALVGENGVGKTTLARLLTGLEKPDNGTIRVDGTPVPARRLSRHVQLVLQNAGHQLRMNSVEAELLDAALVPDGGRDPVRRIMETALVEFGLTAQRDRHPQSLSGGEKQRLAVACAAVRSPRILILDEPTSGLDGANMRGMAESIRKVAGQGASVLVITHDLELMREVCTASLTLRRPGTGGVAAAASGTAEGRPASAPPSPRQHS